MECTTKRTVIVQSRNFCIEWSKTRKRSTAFVHAIAALSFPNTIQHRQGKYVREPTLLQYQLRYELRQSRDRLVEKKKPGRPIIKERRACDLEAHKQGREADALLETNSLLHDVCKLSCTQRPPTPKPSSLSCKQRPAFHHLPLQPHPQVAPHMVLNSPTLRSASDLQICTTI